MKNFGLLPVAVNATWRRTGLMIMLFICGMLLSRTTWAQPITIDGNPIDWTGVFSNGSIQFKTIVVDSVNAHDDVFTGGGSKDDGPISGWQWQVQATNDKSDIENAGLALIGNKLYFFCDRFSTAGDANTGLWVMKNRVQKGPLSPTVGGFIGSHTVGDLFITMQFTGGGGHPERHIYEWNGSGLTEITLSTTAADIASNQFSTYPTPAGSFPTGWSFKTKDSAALNVYTRASFVEGFVNLDSIPDIDFCFTNFIIDTRTSQSTSSLLEDLVLGIFATRPSVTVADDTVCAGSSAVFTAVPSGGEAPYSFAWNGSGTFVAGQNTYTISPATVNTVVTVQVEGGNGCISAPDTANLVIRPAPTVSPHGDSTYCNGVIAGALSFNTSPSGSTVNWTSSVDVGFGTSGTVNPIPAYITQNSGAVPVVATVIVTPTSPNGCVGVPDTFLITVNPTPGPNAPVGNSAICNGALQDTIHLASLDTTVTTFWTSSTDLGFGTSGTGDIPAFIGSNSTSTPIVATVTVTSASTSGCAGADTTGFTITVNPDASPNAPVDNFAICSGTNHDTIDIVGLDLVDTFHWTSSVDIGFGTSGTGKIPAFTATVTPVQIVATVTVTAISPSGCPGETGGFLVTVNPLPVVVARDTSICAGVSFSLDLLSDPDGGTWSGTGSSGTTFNSAGLSAGAHGLLYTYTDANTCTSSDSAYVTILANPTVVARDTAICAGVSFDLNLLSDPDGGTWSGSGVSGTTFNSAGLSGTIGLFYVFENGAGCSGSDSAYITINALPNVVARDTAICAGTSFSLDLLSDPDGGTWSGSGVSGTTFSSAGLSGTVGLNYIYTDGNTCTSSDSAYVTINPLPTVVARDTSICAGVSFSLNLLSDPDGGTWSGTGSSGTTFNSAGLSLGAHGLLYTYTNGNGCTASDSAYVTLTSCGNVFATFTQGFWGSTNGKHCDGAGTQRNAVSLINYLLNNGSGPITIGLPGRSVIIPVTAAVTVNNVMPGGHTPNKLKVGSDVVITSATFASNYLTGGRINNVFLSQMIALKLGTRIIPGLLGFPIQYNPAGNSSFLTCGTSTTNCSTFTEGGACSCWTLKQSVTNYVTKGGTKTATLADLIAIADSLLGGGITPGTTVGGYVVPSYADVSDAIDLFNNAFDNFKSFSGSYGCPVPKAPTADAGENLEAAMRIYPNPTTGTFTIEIPAIDKDAHITIVDLNGRTVMSDVIQANTYGQSKQIDLPRVAPGLYIIHVENDGHIFSKKIMVE